MSILLASLTDTSEKAQAFVSIGKLATALQDKFDVSYIDSIMKYIVDTLIAKKYIYYNKIIEDHHLKHFVVLHY